MNSFPKVIKNKKISRNWILQNKFRGKTIAFVPTMGYLHKGHLALVEKANKLADLTVVSIYVNPTQFGPNEDFQEYPRNLDQDLEKLATFNVDLVFTPSDKEMYSEGFVTTIHVDKLTAPLCGARRPGHFDGVTTIVSKLFNIINPDFAVFGEKDFQQLAVIKRMVKDLDFNLKIESCPTIRESDGLALSSRNQYLTGKQRKEAPVIVKALRRVKELVAQKQITTPSEVETRAKNIIKQNSNCAKIDYIQCLSADNLHEVNNFENSTVLAAAVFFGKTRLIDNIKLT
ncbi:MAG: pantoate--beta-alanine ligase [Deltaproteobacteria bacterium]|jgi:pantoate--beta-alanine ligase|nr:pantoate--beta-alanine ligase [Deltaproteobacteria bacterium]